MDGDDAIMPVLFLAALFWAIWEFEPLSAMSGKNTMYFSDSRCADIQGCDEWQSIDFRVYEDARAVRAFSDNGDEFQLNDCSVLSSDSWNCASAIWPDRAGFDHGEWLSPHPEIAAYNWKTAWMFDWFVSEVYQ